jgi:hypothetical protein
VNALEKYAAKRKLAYALAEFYKLAAYIPSAQWDAKLTRDNKPLTQGAVQMGSGNLVRGVRSVGTSTLAPTGTTGKIQSKSGNWTYNLPKRVVNPKQLKIKRVGAKSPPGGQPMPTAVKEPVVVGGIGGHSGTIKPTLADFTRMSHQKNLAAAKRRRAQLAASVKPSGNPYSGGG